MNALVAVFGGVILIPLVQFIILGQTSRDDSILLTIFTLGMTYVLLAIMESWQSGNAAALNPADV